MKLPVCPALVIRIRNSVVRMGKDMRPMVKLMDDKGKDLNIAGTDMPAHYFLPAGAIVDLEDGCQGGCW